METTHLYPHLLSDWWQGVWILHSGTTTIYIFDHTDNTSFGLTMRSSIASRKAQAFKVFEIIQGSSYLQDLLVIATSPAHKTFFVNKLVITLPDAFAGHTKQPAQLFDIMTTWFGQFEDACVKFDAVAMALKQRQDYFITHRNLKGDFIHRIGLQWSPAARNGFWNSIRVVKLSKLVTPYPPVGHWICETDPIDAKWRKYLEEDPRAQPDRRRPRLPLSRIDVHMLRCDIRAGESVIIIDKDTGELVMVVFRSFSNHPGLLAHIDGVIKRAVEYHKSMRVSDFY